MMGPLLQPKWVPVATPLEERSTDLEKP
jgi:hypothetical protein